MKIIVFLILPLHLLLRFFRQLRDLVNRKNQSVFHQVARILVSLVLLVVITPLWFLLYYFVGYSAIARFNLIATPIPISGTGSMYPTFPKGEGTDPKSLSTQIVAKSGMLPYPNGLVFQSRRIFGYDLNRGDIVVVENDLTRESTQLLSGFPSGWVKRLIALPGDTLELRSGLVYLNGQPLAEPYIAKPQSTFGAGFLSECRIVRVPDDHIFVMGDNRTGSSDSREVGFFPSSDVRYMLPLQKQAGILDANWRDTSADFSPSSEIHLDKLEYLRLLNVLRQSAGVPPLRYQTKLELSALNRGRAILKSDDLSFTATRSGYTMEESLSDVGYWNPLYGEIPVLGHLDAQELIDNQFEFPSSKKFVLDKDFQEVGIAEVQAPLNGCPAQVIVLHFAGYVPPDYSPEIVNSWKKLLTELQEIQPGWSRLVDSGRFYDLHKSDVDRLNEIIAVRLKNTRRIVDQLANNQWLTASEKLLLQEDEKLAAEQSEISARLNGSR